MGPSDCGTGDPPRGPDPRRAGVPADVTPASMSRQPFPALPSRRAPVAQWIEQVYTTLQRLERDGLVETDDGEGERQKRYRIRPPAAES
jgi:hypothetical protein